MRDQNDVAFIRVQGAAGFISKRNRTEPGAALMGIFITSVAGVTFYQAIAPFYPNMSVAPDWLLGILFGLGGMAGVSLGARCQKFIPARAIKWMLASIIIFTGIKYGLAFFAM